MTYMQEPKPSRATQEAIDAIRRLRAPGYDVNAGLARHRALLAQGALPAAYAAQGPLKTLAAWGMSKVGLAMLTVLAVMAALAVRLSHEPHVEARPRAHERRTDVLGADGPARFDAAWAMREAASEGQAGPAVPDPSPLVRSPGQPPPSHASSGTIRPGDARAPSRSRKAVLHPLARPKARFDDPSARPISARAPEGALRPRSSGPSQREPSQGAPQIKDPLEPPATQPERDAAEVVEAEAASTSTPEAARALGEDPTEREMRELAEAERLLRAFPSRALNVARASDARFLPGYLRQERRFVILKALLSLRRVDEAEKVARQYLREDPDRAFRQRVGAILERAP